MVEYGTLDGLVDKPFGVVGEAIYLYRQSFGCRLKNTHHTHEILIYVLTAADIVERISAEHIEVHHSFCTVATIFIYRIKPF